MFIFITKTLRLSQAVLASTLFVAQMAFADIVIDANLMDQDEKTSVQGNITIATSGQLLMTLGAPNSGDAIWMDSDAQVITLINNNQNLNGEAILTTNAARNGITICSATSCPTGAGGGATSTINIGSNTAINAIINAIFIDNTAATITNGGSILSSNAANAFAIAIAQGGTSATITNTLSTSLIQGPKGAIGPNGAVLMGNGLTLDNFGLITSDPIGAFDAIVLNNSFTLIHNESTGVIRVTGAGAGNAINLVSGATLSISGGIQNEGLIEAQGAGAAINIGNVFNGTIVNSGIIRSTTGEALHILNTFGEIDNTGTIEATMVGGTAIFVGALSSGFINNNAGGVIQSVDQAAIVLGGSITQINNASGGVIQNTALVAASPAIDVIANNVTLTGGIVNNGVIMTLSGIDAIDLQTKSGVVATVTQNAGQIVGNVLLASGGGDVLEMNGGSILGSVVAGLLNSNTLNLNGGVITGPVTLGNLGDTVNLNGTVLPTLTTGAGIDIINATGGSFTSLVGMGNNDFLNVKAPFIAGSISGIPNIHVFDGGKLTVAQPITMLNTQLTIDPLGAMVVNNTVTGVGIANSTIDGSLSISEGQTVDLAGNAINNGSISIGVGGLLKVGTYLENAGGVYAPQIGNPGNGLIETTNVGGATLLAGSFIAPYVAGIYIPAGQTYDVIRATNGGPIVDASTMSPSNSIVIFFNKVSGAGGIGCGADTCVRVQAGRHSYESLVISESARGVAADLDLLAIPPGPTNPDLRFLLGNLDLYNNQQALDAALVSLTPIVNYALSQVSHTAFDSQLLNLQRRLEDMQDLRQLGEESYRARRESGYSYGDDPSASCHSKGTCYVPLVVERPPKKEGGAWAKIYGAELTQKKYQEVDGYMANAFGVSVGADVGDFSRATFGFALGYSNINSVGKTDNANILDLTSYQGTIYSWMEPAESYYMDLMINFAANNYSTRRNISINNLATFATANFFGVEYGVQSDVGYAFLYDNLVVTPVVRGKYTRLEVNSYTEDNAGGLNLAVQDQAYNQLIAGAGLRVMGKRGFGQIVYYPEVSAWILYDFCNDQEQTVSNFLGGGATFTSNGLQQRPVSYLLDIGIDAFSNDNYVATVKYELETRDHFVSNAAYFQLRYQWGG